MEKQYIIQLLNEYIEEEGAFAIESKDIESVSDFYDKNRLRIDPGNSLKDFVCAMILLYLQRGNKKY